MRNLKKVLSLALAMVMLLGMMVVGAGATSFTDDADITHQEAVTVVSGMEILTGVGDNTFNPKGTLSRAEAAVVIAKLDLGAAFGNLATTNASTFKDVGAGYGWAKPYIDYCAARGLIAGDGNGYFMPADKVTGVQFALMVARVLGYEDANESIGGADWEVNAAALARKAGLTIDVTLGSNPIPRDDMAQVAFNALQADMVEYKNSSITIGNVTIPAGKATARDEGTVNYNRDTKNTLQLCEEKFPKLVKFENHVDDFGRPGVRWRYNGKDVIEVANDATASYSAEVTAKQLYADLGLTKNTVASVLLDGAAAADFNIQKSSSTALPGSGNGVIVEAYKDDDGNVTIVIMNVYAGKISKVTPAKDNDARYVTVSSKNFETESFAKDDVVIYTMANGDIKTMALANKVEGATVTRLNGTSNFTAGGTTYKYNKVQKSSVISDVKVGSILDLYLDANDYVVRVDVSKGTSDYAYVLDVGDEGRYDNDTTYYAKLLLTDGTQVDAKLDKDNCKAANGSSINLSTNKADLNTHVVEYTKDSKDVYSLTIKSSAKLTTTSNQTITIEKGKAGMTLGSNARYADSKTVFLVKSGDNWTAYTGYANVPTLKSTTGNWAVYVDGSIAKVVVVTGANAESDDIVYVLASKAGTLVREEDRDDYYEYKAVVNGEITTVKAKARVGGDTGRNETGSDVLYSSIVYSNEEQGVIDFANSTPYINTGDNKAVVGTVNKKFENGTLGIDSSHDPNDGNYAVAEDVEVYAVTAGDKIESSDMSEMDDAAVTAATPVTAVVKNGKIVALFYGASTTSGAPSGEAEITRSVKAFLATGTSNTVTFAVAGGTSATIGEKTAAIKDAAAAELSVAASEITVKVNGNVWTVSANGTSVDYTEQAIVKQGGIPNDVAFEDMVNDPSNGYNASDAAEYIALNRSEFLSKNATVTPTSATAATISGLTWFTDLNVKVPGYGGLRDNHTLMEIYGDARDGAAAAEVTARNVVKNASKWAIVAVTTPTQNDWTSFFLVYSGGHLYKISRNSTTQVVTAVDVTSAGFSNQSITYSVDVD